MHKYTYKAWIITTATPEGIALFHLFSMNILNCINRICFIENKNSKKKINDTTIYCFQSVAA